MRQSKQLTLRLPPDLYQSSVRLAKRRKMSLNKLAQTGLERLAAEDALTELQAAYDTLGADADSNVEPFLAAQREVVFGDE